MDIPRCTNKIRDQLEKTVIYLVLIIFPILYLLTGTVPGIKSYWQAIYFSIVTATTLGYGDFHPEGLGTFLASLEAIFGTFMWALLITTLGRKYLNSS
ncbi:potassium channel family protein [Thermococcus litoralis]|uniref:potassium channel family protein n=1 Tax=Thermococcus litoralis TaxID=2265 RepID=UPI003743BB95